jgi:hypothetical protein
MIDLTELNDSKLSMNLISREELKEKLDRGDGFKLENALEESAFEAKRIGFYQHQQYARRKKMLDPSDYIVIHCSNTLCPASIIEYQILERNGYKKNKALCRWIARLGGSRTSTRGKSS